jgi:hypothetical protein
VKTSLKLVVCLLACLVAACSKQSSDVPKPDKTIHEGTVASIGSVNGVIVVRLAGMERIYVSKDAELFINGQKEPLTLLYSGRYDGTKARVTTSVQFYGAASKVEINPSEECQE